MAIYMWFDLRGVREFAATRNFIFYVLLFAELFVPYLIAASSLPSAGLEHDLREFYSRNRRRFWFLIVLFQIGYVAAGFYFISGSIEKLPLAFVAFAVVQMFAPLVLAAILYLSKSRLVHYIGLVLLFAVILVRHGKASIN